MPQEISLQHLPTTLSPDKKVLTLSVNLHKLQYLDGEQIQLKNALAQVEKLLSDQSETVRHQMLRQINQLLESDLPYAGITMFIQQDSTDLYYLPRTTVTELSCTIGMQPDLLSILSEQPNQNYYLLALEGDTFRLYNLSEGNLAPVKLTADAPTDLIQTLGSEKRGGETNYSVKAGNASFHGHNETSQEKQIDLERYYRAIADYLTQSIDLTIPVILMGLAKNISTFQQVTDKLTLAKLTVTKSPSGMTDRQIEASTADTIKDHEIKSVNDDVQALQNQTVLTETQDIENAIDTNRLSQLIVNLGEPAMKLTTDQYNQLNRLIADALQIRSKVVVLKQDDPRETQLLQATMY